MKICYVPKNFSASSLSVIDDANDIINEYRRQGYDLTLRQLYYQFVSRDLLANNQKEYKRLGSIINDARLAGLLSWEAIIDRTRNLEKRSHWASPSEIIATCAKQYHEDMWGSQDTRIEVWIEKDALIGVIAGICHDMDLPHFSCRGYTSQSEMWVASQRILDYHNRGQNTVILHLGDHDPSGIDMSRDIEDRLRLFTELDHYDLEVKRIALNYDQIEEYAPPPNPAKLTDSRAEGYIQQHGYSSWELDALDPATLVHLISVHVQDHRDQDRWQSALNSIDAGKDVLRQISKNLKED